MGTTPHTGHVRLEDLFCREARFRQVRIPSSGEGGRRRIGTPEELEVGITLATQEQGEDRADVELTVQVEPDEEGKQPYAVVASYLGRFRFGELPEGLSKQSFIERNAAAIMLPYVREAIGNLTSRGAYGPLFLPPINVVAMLDREKDREDAPQVEASDA